MQRRRWLAVLGSAATWLGAEGSMPSWMRSAPNLPGHVADGMQHTRYWSAPFVDMSNTSSRAGERRRLHVLVIAKPEACGMLTCWSRWFTNMQMHDERTEYRLHLWSYPSLSPNSTGEFNSDSFKKAVTAKGHYVLEFMNSMPDGTLIMYTDIDVLPVRTFDHLLDYMDGEARSFEFVCMYDYLDHIPCNSGFWIARNTPTVRLLIARWVRKFQVAPDFRPEREQVWLNMGILNEFSGHRFGCKPEFNVPTFSMWGGNTCNTTLRWGHFPPRLVTAKPEHIGENLVAYHATGVTGATAKLEKLRDGLVTVHNITPGHWQFNCSLEDTRSCPARTPKKAAGSTVQGAQDTGKEQHQHFQQPWPVSL